MRIFISVNSMVLLSLSTLSLTSCGRSNMVDSELNAVTPNKVVVSCSSILKLGSINITTYPLENPENPVKGRIDKIDKRKKTFELNIFSSSGDPLTLYGRFDGKKTIIDEYALVECYSNKTMSLTTSPCSSVIKNGDISWTVEQDTYKNTGKGTISVTSVDRLKGNMTFKFTMKSSQATADDSHLETYTGKTEGEKVTYTLDDNFNKVSFSGSCVENKIIATYDKMKHTLTK